MARKDLLANLNESQLQAATHIEGPLLVLAGPGSGKTRVVTHRIAYLIDQGVDPRGIVALTFTNKAADEMRSRVQSLVGDVDIWMGTFHGFCVRLLRRYARLVGLPENFSIYDTSDSEAALKAAIQSSDFELTHTSVGSLANRISYFKNRLVTPEILEAEALSSDEHAVAQVYPHYQRELLSNGAVDFDDILMHTAMMLRSNPELREEWDQRLQHVMVDEYQDTNLAQYVIIRLLSVNAPNVAATGDPDQSIYGWRGANAKNVSKLQEDYPQLKVVRLEDNYRSSPEILAVADHLIQHNEYRMEKHLLPTKSGGKQVRLAVYPSARAEAEEIADEVLTAHENGASLSDFAVLYRTNAQSRLFEHAMMRRGLNFQLIGGYRFYMRKEIKDLVAYLLLIHNPEDNVALLRAINSPARGIGKQTIAKLQELANRQGVPLLEACRQCAGVLSKRANSSVRGFLKIYDQLCTLVHGPLVDLLESTIELTKYREYLKKQSQASEGDDLTGNLDELLAEAYELDQLQDFTQSNDLDIEQTPLEKFLEFAALQSESDRFDQDSDKLTLMTLHAAKGLEFSNVYIAAVEENILPHSRSKDDPMQLEEERRLLFVGITRAESQLQISYAKRRGFSGQGSGVPSSFLMELPRSDMQIIDRTEGRFFGGDSFSGQGFDEYDQSASNVQWDEYSQVESYSGDSESGDSTTGEEYAADQTGMDLDDCQLPPEEIKARMQKLQSLSSKAGLMLGSDIATADATSRDGLGEFDPHAERPSQRDAFPEGTWVHHPRWGIGEVIAAQGHGLKRSVTIHFSADSSHRSFRVSHADLKAVPTPS